MFWLASLDLLLEVSEHPSHVFQAEAPCGNCLRELRTMTDRCFFGAVAFDCWHRACALADSFLGCLPRFMANAEALTWVPKS